MLRYTYFVNFTQYRIISNLYTKYKDILLLQTLYAHSRTVFLLEDCKVVMHTFQDY